MSHSYHYEDGGISRPLGKRKADDDLMPRITAKGLKAGRRGGAGEGSMPFLKI